jgi:hypothetical protein
MRTSEPLLAGDRQGVKHVAKAADPLPRGGHKVSLSWQSDDVPVAKEARALIV